MTEAINTVQTKNPQTEHYKLFDQFSEAVKIFADKRDGPKYLIFS